MLAIVPLADVPAEDPRRGRAAAENIIPQETNAAQVIMSLLPEMRGKLEGLAINVPVANGSVVDLVCWHERSVTVEAVNEVVRTAAKSERWKHILAYEDDPIVSSDISIGLVMGLKAFIALALGGFNSLRGCIVGGLLLGVGEYLVDVYGAANLQPLAGLGLLLLVLIVRPTGIFGVRAVREV